MIGAGALRAAPMAALLPGFAGTLPFLALALALAFAEGGSRAQVELAFVGYGAVILTFVGALHWGLALAATARLPEAGAAACFGFLWSVVPALWGWLALLLPLLPALAMLAAGFAVQFAVDRRVAGELALPAWYLALRLWLTTIVMLMLLVACAAVTAAV
jgi:hypothetical protein